MSILRTYDPSALTCSIAGVRLRGYADADAVTIAPQNDLYTSSTGTDGEVTRVKINDPRRLVTVRLAQSSESNDYLSSLVKADQGSSSGAGVGDVVVRDGSGTTVLEGKGWVMRLPEQGFGRAVGTREWQIEVVVRNEVVGGNPAVA